MKDKKRNSSSVQVSIALATHNGETYLDQQLKSLLDQTHIPGEIIICDDCSTDETMKIVNKYQQKYPQIFKVFYNTEVLGYIHNFEKCISLCSCEYIALCDQDDIWNIKKLEILLSAIGDKILIHSDARLVDNMGNVISESYTSFAGKTINSISFNQLLHKNHVTGCTMLFRKELALKALPFPSLISHDWWLTLLAANEGGIAYCNQALVDYRQHEKNAIGAKSAKNLSKTATSFSFLEQQDRRNKKLLECYSELYEFSIGRFGKKNIKKIEHLEYFYKSYFQKSIRPKAFMMFLLDWRSYSSGMSFYRSLKRLFLSLVGRKVFISRRREN